MKLLFISTLFFAFSPCISFAKMETCPFAYSAAAVAPSAVTRVEYMKQYLAINLMFPASPEPIFSSLTAYIVAKQVPPEVFRAPITDDEWQMSFTAMKRAHKAHRLRRRISLEHLKAMVGPVHDSLPLLVENATREPLATDYAKTIFAALTSTEIRDLAGQYRRNLSRTDSQRERLDLRREFGLAFGTRMKSVLAETHPELDELVTHLGGYRLAKPFRQAHLAYRSFADPGF